MNGPQHYREARKLIAETVGRPGEYPMGTEDVIATGVVALTHAVLALTAATLDVSNASAPLGHIENGPEWRDARKADQ